MMLLEVKIIVLVFYRFKNQTTPKQKLMREDYMVILRDKFQSEKNW